MGDTADYSVQPRPLQVDGAVSVHDLVMEDLRAMFTGEGLELGLAAVQGRKDFGLTKYGTVLHTANGRDYLADVDDEVGDLAAYLRAVISRDPTFAKKRGLYKDYRQVLTLMVKVRSLLAARGTVVG